MIEMDENLLNDLVDVIYGQVKKKMERQLNDSSVEFSTYGVVCGVGTDGTVNVNMGYNETGFIPNYSGEALSVGDKVKIFYDNFNLKNVYVGLSCSTAQQSGKEA